MNTGRRDTDALDSGANSDDDEADGEIGPRYSETGDSHGWQIGSCEHGKGSGTALRAFAAYSGKSSAIHQLNSADKQPQESCLRHHPEH